MTSFQKATLRAAIETGELAWMGAVARSAIAALAASVSGGTAMASSSQVEFDVAAESILIGPGGQLYVPYDELPTPAKYILQNRWIDPATGQIVLTTPNGYYLISAPTGGGYLLVPRNYTGGRQNVIRLQPYGTGSSTTYGYSKGYYVVYNKAGAAISIYSGQPFKDSSPAVHNEFSIAVPNLGELLGPFR
jgi:hypothetical protein